MPMLATQRKQTQCHVFNRTPLVSVEENKLRSRLPSIRSHAFAVMCFYLIFKRCEKQNEGAIPSIEYDAEEISKSRTLQHL